MSAPEHPLQHRSPATAAARTPRAAGTGRGGRTRSAPAPPAARSRLGQQQQVVVVDPAKPELVGIVGGGELLVDEAVRIPPGAVERRPLDEAVQERPESAIRKPVVVRVDLAPRERDRPEADLEALDARRRLGAAVPPDPDAAARRHRGLQRRHQTAVGQPPAVPRTPDRQAIRERDHRELVAWSLHDDSDPKPSRRLRGRLPGRRPQAAFWHPDRDRARLDLRLQAPWPAGRAPPSSS